MYGLRNMRCRKALWKKECDDFCLDTDPSGNMICIRENGALPQCFHGEGNEWHKIKESAISKAEKMRQKKIASLKKQIAKLKNMKFE